MNEENRDENDDDVIYRLKESVPPTNVEAFMVFAEIMRDKYLAYRDKDFTDNQALFILCWEFFGVRMPT